jgi:hypothetical protein
MIAAFVITMIQIVTAMVMQNSTEEKYGIA